jgi:hypothetical protein
MLRFNASAFVNAYTFLEYQGFCCHLHRVGGESLEDPLSEEDKKRVSTLLSNLEGPSTHASLGSVISQIRRAQSMINEGCTYGNLASLLEELGNWVRDELGGRRFMFMPEAEAACWSAQTPFGKKVADKFPKVKEDVVEASKCLGVRRYTASVFHLMRVMEAGMRHLVKLLGLTATISVEQSWGVLLKPVEAQIVALPGGLSATEKQRARRAAFSETATFLRHVKDAWRNDTMHPKRTYTEEEAKNIFAAVKAFMRALVKLR